jgi:hypothetical protein
VEFLVKEPNQQQISLKFLGRSFGQKRAFRMTVPIRIFRDVSD